MGCCCAQNHACLLQYLRDGKWLAALACWEFIHLPWLEVYFINSLQGLFYRLKIADRPVVLINRREQLQRRVISNQLFLHSMQLHPFRFISIFTIILSLPFHNNQIQIIRMSFSLSTTIHKILEAFTHRWKDISLFAIIN